MPASTTSKSQTARRRGAEDSETRARLLAAATEIMRTDGISKVTTDRLAKAVGLKRYSVHYYFGSIDEVHAIIAEQDGDKTATRFRNLIETEGVERAFTGAADDLLSLAASFELQALAMRSDVVGQVVKSKMARFTEIGAQALSQRLEQNGVSPHISPHTMAILLSAVRFSISAESRFGFDEHKDEVSQVLEALLARYLQTGGLFDAEASGSQRHRRAVDDRPEGEA